MVEEGGLEIIHDLLATSTVIVSRTSPQHLQNYFLLVSQLSSKSAFFVADDLQWLGGIPAGVQVVGLGMQVSKS